MSKTTPKRLIEAPTAKENRKILAAARKDPDAAELTPVQLAAMIPLKTLQPGHKPEPPRHAAKSGKQLKKA